MKTIRKKRKERVSECGPLGKKSTLLLVLATQGMDPASTDWSEFSAELSTAEPSENRKNKAGQSPPVCPSVC